MALRAGELFANAVVVAVEQVLELRLEHPIVGEVGLEKEGLEEPGGVGQMPAGRAHVGAGLQPHVLGEQRVTELFAEGPDTLVARHQCGAGVLSGGIWQGLPSQSGCQRVASTLSESNNVTRERGGYTAGQHL